VQQCAVRFVTAQIPRITETLTFAVHDFVDDRVVSEAIATNGIWEPFETEIFRRMLTDGRAHHVVDCGANLGWYTVLAAHLGAHVTAFEPMPNNITLLESNVDRNNLRTYVRIVPCAVGSAQRVEASVDEESGGETLEARTVDVPVTTIDETLREQSWPLPTLIKIDTQGSETAVVRGGRATWNRTASATFIIEFWPYGLVNCGSSADELLDELATLFATSQCYEIVEWRSCLVERSLDDLRQMASNELRIEDQRFTNLLIIPHEYVVLIADLVKDDVDWELVKLLENPTDQSDL
jgi:FkbM family methyltransferase